MDDKMIAIAIFFGLILTCVLWVIFLGIAKSIEQDNTFDNSCEAMSGKVIHLKRDTLCMKNGEIILQR